VASRVGGRTAKPIIAAEGRRYHTPDLSGRTELSQSKAWEGRKDRDIGPSRLAGNRVVWVKWGEKLAVPRLSTIAEKSRG